MKRLSLQWRITLMTAILIGITCILMNCLISSAGKHYMDSIGEGIAAYSEIEKEGTESFNPESEKLDDELTIIVSGAQDSFNTTNWVITAIVTLLGGILAYFVSGRGLKPLRNFAAQVENVHPNNLPEMKISEDVMPEFKRFSRSFNSMIERLDEGFSAQRQFTGNAAHELRTPLALMQAQVELFAAEHPAVEPETADLLRIVQEQTERMTQMTRTLLEMSELQAVPCDDRIEIAPMIEEILTDFAPIAEEKGTVLECDGEGVVTGSDTLIYRMIFNLVENAIRYNRPGGRVHVAVNQEDDKVLIRVKDEGYGIPEQYRESIFQPFFRIDKSRSREHGGVGLGLSLVWEIAVLHGGTVTAEESSEQGTTMLISLPKESPNGDSAV